MKHLKKFTKDNVATFLQTLLVLYLLGYSAVNGNAGATLPSNPTVQQPAVTAPAVRVAVPLQHQANTAKKQVQSMSN